MMAILFVMLLAVSAGSLYFGVKRQHWALCAIATISGAFLAMQASSIDIPTGRVVLVIREASIQIGAWVLTAISLAFTIYGLISYAGNRRGAAAPAPGGRW